MENYQIIDGVLSFDESINEVEPSQFKNNKLIKHIVIGKNIENIGAEAFSMCSNIETIEVDSSNKKYCCPNKSNSIVEIDSGLLIAGCKNTVIDKSVKDIGPFAFSGQSELSEITIPSNVKRIMSYAFDGCNNLKKVVISDGVEEIHEFAFRHCDSLESVSLPYTLKVVERSSFGLTIATDPDFYGMLLDEGDVKVNTIIFSGTKEDFYQITNFRKIFVLDSNLSYSDMTIHCSNGDILLSNKWCDD